MYPRVKDIIMTYHKGGLVAVTEYLNQEGMTIDPDTWSGHIKRSIDEGYTVSVEAEIQLLIEKFNFYKDVSKEKERRRTSTVNGEGNSGDKEKTNG